MRPTRLKPPLAALAAVVASLSYLVACSPQYNATFTNIANQGVVPVSADNAYVGSNIFLAKEMEESVYLYNFMQRRGSPQAIEVVGSSEEKAELTLFYSDKNESYRATPQIDKRSKTKEWIVRGPYAIDRNYWRQITSLPNEGGVFEVFGKKEVFGGRAVAAETRVIAPAFVPTPHPTPRPVKKKVAPSKDTTGAPAISGPIGTPSNLDQEALLEARRSPPTPPAQAPTVASSPGAKAIDDALDKTISQAPALATSAANAATNAIAPKASGK
jgi:hypothetical protein